jgi:hypothetical protein
MVQGQAAGLQRVGRRDVERSEAFPERALGDVGGGAEASGRPLELDLPDARRAEERDVTTRDRLARPLVERAGRCPQ